MVNNKILYSAFIQTLVKSAADANACILQTYLQALKNNTDTEKRFYITPPVPLVVTDMRFSFSAHVSRGERPVGGDLVLDFTKQSNFQGEIKLRPHKAAVMDEGVVMDEDDVEPPCDICQEEEPQWQA